MFVKYKIIVASRVCFQEVKPEHNIKVRFYRNNNERTHASLHRVPGSPGHYNIPVARVAQYT